MWQNILFDLDGTITDPEEGITGSARFALESMGRPALPQEVLRKFIGPPLDEMFSEVCGFTGEEVDRAITLFRKYYTETGHQQLILFDGMRELFAGLTAAGHNIFLATTKPVNLAEDILHCLDLYDYFTLVMGSPIGHRGQKKGDVIRRLLEQSGIDAATAIMVGDRRHDVIGAHENNMPCIGFLPGFGGREELEAAGAEFIVEDVPALRALLLGEGA